MFGTRGWDELFTDLGLRLPNDYVAFIERYGSCDFARWLTVADLRRLTREQCAYVPEWMDYYRDLREDSPEDFTLAMWPEPGGFFRWGSTIDGDAMGWMTEGEPEQWPVMVITHGDDEELLQESMTEWLAGWATGARFGASALTDEAGGHPLICEPFSW